MKLLIFAKVGNYCYSLALISCFQARKKSTKINFWVRRPPGGVGVFHAKGWWPKSSCSPSKVCLPWVSTGMSRDFCRDVPDPWGCSKSLFKKTFVLVFRPLPTPACLGICRPALGGKMIRCCFFRFGELSCR